MQKSQIFKNFLTSEVQLCVLWFVCCVPELGFDKFELFYLAPEVACAHETGQTYKIPMSLEPFGMIWYGP